MAVIGIGGGGFLFVGGSHPSTSQEAQRNKNRNKQFRGGKNMVANVVEAVEAELKVVGATNDEESDVETEEAEENEDTEADEEIEDEIEEEQEAAPTKKERQFDLDAFLKEDVDMVVRHSKYQILEFWKTPNDAEGWATEIIDLIEIRQVVEFQRPLARRVMERMPELPNKAVAYIRKHFNLWDVDLGR